MFMKAGLRGLIEKNPNQSGWHFTQALTEKICPLTEQAFCQAGLSLPYAF